ncbi:response regulator transcription factor [Gryllotalpicola reticulitermitis]|uniref:Response regulator transcription factor n=1 Tax=Gryllotalpicola reticulitermitis TaxID=1184153 RepID=A0ABV8Q8K3_9MICO
MSERARRTAVVIEDDEGIRSLICDVLKHAGLRVVPTTNGIDGITAVREHDPAVVTVDLRMPGIDGIETTKRIRATSSALIVVLSARVTDADEFESLAAGADAYISKPFRPRELRARVDEHLHESRSA